MLLRDVLRVLVVDDMSTSRGLLMQGLDVLGVSNVAHAADGQTAWASARHDPPHLILSDLHMPGMSGLELLSRLRSEDQTKACRFILVTGEKSCGTMRQALPAGLDGLLMKPFTVPQLRECVESAVGRL